MTNTVGKALNLMDEVRRIEHQGERVEHLLGIASGKGGFEGTISSPYRQISDESVFTVNLTEVDRQILIRALALYDEEREKRLTAKTYELKGMLK